MRVRFLLALCTVVKSELILWGALSDGHTEIDIGAQLLAYSACYLGFGFTRCRAEQPDDDAVFRNELPYYRNFDQVWGLNYCLQCCAENAKTDIWDLKCEYDADTGPQINLYGYELRFARNAYIGDTGVTNCVIPRTACTYDDLTGMVEECDTVNDKTYLVGIEATLHVEIRSEDFFSYRSVTKCSVVSIERNHSLETGEHFIEKYIIHHETGPHEWSAFDGSLLSLLCIAFIYVILYYCRRQHCIICAKKLVFFKDRCYLCRFYGAHPPDPLLLKAMEEKGEYLQGEMPERFPGSKRMVKICVGCWNSLKCCCNCCSKFWYYFTCCGCYCIRCCCMKKKKVHGESGVDSVSNGNTNSTVSSNPTALDGKGKAPKKEKVNPYIIKVHPYFVYKVLDHPNPPEAPEWVKRRVPEEDLEAESKYGGPMMRYGSQTSEASRSYRSPMKVLEADDDEDL
jgi:hypothetical protein